MPLSPSPQQLRDAILSAYPDEGDLEIFVFDALGENLGAIAGGDNLSQVVFKLIRWAEAQGKLETFISQLCDRAGDNSKVRAICGISSPTSSSTPKPDSPGTTSSPASASSPRSYSGERRAFVLTALIEETDAVLQHLEAVEEETSRIGTVYYVGWFEGKYDRWKVWVCQTSPGNRAAAREAGRAIELHEPHVALFVGVAGGLKDDVRLGDVVAATKVYGYQSGKAANTFEPRQEIGNSSYPLIQRAQAEARPSKKQWLQRIYGEVSPEEPPRAFVKPIAAGEAVVSDIRSEVYKFLRAQCGDAIAVEMEGIGFLEAAREYQSVQALVVRGISDLIEKKGETDKQGWQEKAARHASAFAFEVLSKLQLHRSPGVSDRVLEWSENVRPERYGELQIVLDELWNNYPALVREIYRKCLPEGWPRKPATNAIAAIEDLDDAGALAQFLAHLFVAEEIPKPSRHRLKIWAEQHDSSAFREALEKFQLEDERDRLPYLAIALHAVDRKYAVEAWLHSGDRDGDYEPLESEEAIEPMGIDELFPNDKPCSVLQELVDRGLDRCGGAELHIEFFLPRALLDRDVDCLKIRALFNTRACRLGMEHPVTIRSLERLTPRYHKRYGSRWQQKWQKFRNKATADVFCSADSEGEKLHADLEEALGLKVGFLCPHRKEDVFDVLLKWAVPVALWFRRSVPNASCMEACENLLRDRILQLPQHVRELRKKAAGKKEEAHLGHHIALLWDDPNRIPESQLLQNPSVEKPA